MEMYLNKDGWEYAFIFEDLTLPFSTPQLYNGENWKKSNLFYGYVPLVLVLAGENY